MGVTDLFAGEIATELLKQLFHISQKSAACRSSAEQLIVYINDLHPIIQEIKHSGNELPQFRQRQLDDFSQTLSGGRDLAAKVLNSPRWDFCRNFRLARKMEKLEHNVSRFMNTLHAHVLADVHRVKVIMEERFDGLEGRLGAMKIGEGGSLGEAVKRVEEEERWCKDSFVNLGGAALEIGKRKVKQMLMREEEEGSVVFGIHGIGGSGKTTLAREICRDDEITTHFNNRVFHLTVSQSPNVDQLRSEILGMVSGNFTALMFPQVKPQNQTRNYVRTLLVLDDVWSQSVLEQLVLHITGCKILVVSRLKFSPSVVKCSYKLDLLSEDEALSLFCHFAFGQSSIPFGTDQQLVKQVVDECKRLPLALKVIGSSLRGESDEKIWLSAINRLSRGQSPCDSHAPQLQERMKLSIDHLSEKQRECFLDFGAFPEDKKIPVDILINMWVELHDVDETEAFAILVELSNKNLLTLVKDTRSGDKYSSYFEISVYQHDVLRDLAIYLSTKETTYAKKRINQQKRLLMPKRETGLPKDWERNADEPFNAQVISIHTGEMKDVDWFNMNCPKAEVLILNFSSAKFFLPPWLANMPKLRALILINYGISSAILDNTSVFSNLTNLRSILFEKISIPILPPTTTPLRSLKKVSLVLCDIKNSIDCSVTNLPHLFPRLSELVMDHCINLTFLPPTITQMQELNSLSVTSCDSLQELPSGFGNLSSLQILRLYGCPNLKRLPLGLCELVRLKYLDISQCVRMEGLPERIGGCIKLEKIDMRECRRVKNLPDSVTGLKSLSHVVCDEDVSYMWRDVQKKSVSGLCVHVPEECFSLDWLVE